MKKTESILIDKKYASYCALCGTPLSVKTEHHLLFGVDRKKAEEDGLKVPICDNCHTMNGGSGKLHGNIIADKLSKIAGQLAYEKQKCADGMTPEEAREAFLRRYKKSYL